LKAPAVSLHHDAELEAAGVELAEEPAQRHPGCAGGHRAHERRGMEQALHALRGHETVITYRYVRFLMISWQPWPGSHPLAAVWPPFSYED
jgi:hypothetical protein